MTIKATDSKAVQPKELPEKNRTPVVIDQSAEPPVMEEDPQAQAPLEEEKFSSQSSLSPIKGRGLSSLDDLQPMDVGSEQQAQAREVQVRQQKEETAKTVTEDIEHIIQVNQNAQDRGSFANKAIGFSVDTAAEGMEKLANFGIDVRNSVSEMFGNENPIEKIDIISRNIEDGQIRETFRYVGQSLVWMAGMSAGAGAAAGVAGVTMPALASAGVVGLGAMTAEMIFNPGEDYLSQRALKSLPFGQEVQEFLDDPFGDEDIAQRLEWGVYGAMDAALGSVFIKGLKAIKPAYRLARKKLDKLRRPQRVVGDVNLGKTTVNQAEGVTEAAEQSADELLIPPVPDDAVKARVQTAMEREAIKNRPKVSERPFPDKEDFLPATLADMDRLSNALKFKKGNLNKLLFKEDGERVYKNVTKLNTTDDVRSAITSVMEDRPDIFKKKKYTFEDLEEASKTFNMTPRKLQDMADIQGLDLGMLLAARKVELDSALSLLNLNSEFIEGLISQDEMALAYRNYTQVSKTVSDMSTLSSAIFREGAVPIETSVVRAEAAKDIDRIAKEAEDLLEFYGDEGIEEFSKALSNLNHEMTAKYGEEFAEEMVSKTLKQASRLGPSKANDLVNHIRYGGMLSDPMTDGRNIMLGMEAIGLRNAETWVAATINATTARGLTRQQGTTFKEAFAETYGFFQGTQEAIQLVSKRLAAYSDDKLNSNLQKLTGEPQDFLGVREGFDKVPDMVTATGEADSLTSAIVTELIKSPARALKMGDNFVKHISARMTLAREAAAREAAMIRQGRKSADEIAEETAKFKAAPSNSTINKMFAEAEEATMTQEIQGNWLKSLNSLTDPNNGKVNWLVGLFAPFARSHINSAVHRLERVPLLNRTLSTFRDQINHTNPRIRQRAQAKQIATTAILSTPAIFFGMTNSLTGPNPNKQNKDESPMGQSGSPVEPFSMTSPIPRDQRYHIYDAQGLMPNSIIMPNGKAIEYPKQSAMGGILYSFSRLAQISDIIDDGNDDMYSEIGTATAIAITELYNVDYLAESLPTLVEAIKLGDEETVQNIVKAGGSILTQHLPFAGASRRANRIFNEAGQTKRDIKPSGSGIAAIMDSIYNEVLNIYAPQGLSPKRDILGYEVPHKEGLGPMVVAPFNVRPMTENKVMQELAWLAEIQNLYDETDFAGEIQGQATYTGTRLEASMPSRTITPPGASGLRAEPIRLNNNQYEKLVLLSAGIHERIPERLKLENTLKDFFQSDIYQRSSKPVKAMATQSIINKYKELGRMLYFKEEVGIEKIREFGKTYKEMVKQKYFLDK